jgi:hypothetical protein
LTYQRTTAQRQGDFKGARAFEEQVALHLPEWRVTEFDHTDRLDVWVPGYYVEVKTKGQPLTARWHRLEGVEERDLFVMDELSVRRALKYYPEAYFLIYDIPENRYFIANAIEFALVERARLNRAGKGKWIVNLANFRRLASLDQINELVQADLASLWWKQSPCWAPVKEIAEV